MHNDVWERMIDTIEREDRFLPITNARISPDLVNVGSKFGFVDINKDKTLFIAQSQTS